MLVLCLGLIVVEPLAEENSGVDDVLVINLGGGLVLDLAEGFLQLPERVSEYTTVYTVGSPEYLAQAIRNRLTSYLDDEHRVTLLKLLESFATAAYRGNVAYSSIDYWDEYIADYRESMERLYYLAHPESGTDGEVWSPNAPRGKSISTPWDRIPTGKGEYVGEVAIREFASSLAFSEWKPPTVVYQPAPSGSSTTDLTSLSSRISSLESRVASIERNCCGSSGGSSGGDYSYEIQQLQYEIENIQYYLDALYSYLQDIAGMEGWWWDPPRTPW